MLVQSLPVANAYPVRKVSFKGNENKLNLEDERDFYEQQRKEIQGLIEDEHMPKFMKKFFKVAGVITDGIVAGISVACATLAGASYGKKSFAKVASSNFMKNTIKTFEPLKNGASKGAEKLEGYAAKGADKFFETGFGKKVSELYHKFASSNVGKKVVTFVKKVIEKTKEFITKLNPFKNEASYDKASQKVATILGTGSGAASAYSTAIKPEEGEQ